jgi:drug/metabolite transporter (DMT)-like permease
MIRLRELLTAPPTLVALAMVMWVVTEIIVAVTFGRAYPIPQIVWLRYAFHLALMILILGLPYGFTFIRTRRPWLQLVRSLLMLVMPLSYALAIQQTRWSNVAAIFWMAPLLVMIMGAFAGERAPRFAWITALLALLGVVVLYRPSLTTIGGAAVLMTLATAASFSGYIVLTRVLDRTEPMLTNLFHSALGVFIALSIPLVTFWVPISTRQMVGALLVAVCGWLTLWLLELGLRQDSPGRLAPFLFVQALLEWGIRANRATLADIPRLGALFVVVASLCVAYWCSQRKGRTRATVAGTIASPSAVR